MFENIIRVEGTSWLKKEKEIMKAIQWNANYHPFYTFPFFKKK